MKKKVNKIYGFLPKVCIFAEEGYNVMDAIITYLLELAPWIVAIIVVTVISVRFTWKLAKYHSNLETTKEKVSTLPCAQHKGEIDELKTFAKSFDSMADRFEEVCKWIMRNDINAIDNIAPKHSPRKMNDIGLEVYAETGAKQVFEDNAAFFLEELTKKDPKTAYDVEEAAFEVLLANLQNPLYNPIKNYLYSGPSKVVKKDSSGNDLEVELSMGLLLQLMSLELRDRYLELHPMA